VKVNQGNVKIKLRTAFLLFNYLLTAMALYCLTLSRVFSALFGVTLFCALGLCLILEVKKIIPVKPPLKILSSGWGLILLPLLYFSFEIALMDLLVWVLTVLLFSRLVFKTALNDTVFGYLISLACLLLGAMVAHDLEFAILFLAFYLVLSWGLITYNMMAEQAGSNSPPAVFKLYGENAIPGGRLLGFSACLMILGLVLTTLIFTSFPRLGQSLSQSGPSSPTTGFSESVRLGDVGQLKQNSQVVMRIEFEKDGKPHRPQSPVYWRGIVLDHFNGSSWFSTVKPKWKFSNQPGVGVQLRPFTPKTRVIRQNLYMDAFGSDVIFSRGLPLLVDGNFQSIQVNDSFSLKSLDWQNRSRRVTLISSAASSRNSPANRAFNDHNSPLLKKFLQLPAMSPQIIRLAKSLTENADSEEKANNILGHLRSSEFGYTLEQTQSAEQTPLDHFLFTRKKGHCEYFASSMVMLLRLSGVPARLVNGFIGLEWNDLGEYMVVRQHHAHSWVEAFLPEKGWVIYDPTPADPMFALNNFDDPLNRSLDLLRLNWQRYFLSYSLMDQALLLNHLQSTGEETLSAIKGLGKLEVGPIKTFIIDNLVVLSGLFGLALILVLKWKKLPGWWFFISSKKPGYPVWLYRKMLKKLRIQGIHKQPSSTPREFLSQLSTLPDDKLEPLQKITACYEKSRFGQFTIRETEKRELLNQLRKI
jgi:hypothetical protein